MLQHSFEKNLHVVYGGNQGIEFGGRDQSVAMSDQIRLEVLHTGQNPFQAEKAGPVEDLALWAVALINVMSIMSHRFASRAFKTRAHVASSLSSGFFSFDLLTAFADKKR
jgi:heme/copper-type cytochrome/quinol oxidase subunit 1